MCRHLAYLGPPVTLADCVLHQPHSLVDQSWAPTDMRGGGTVNADGFGIGWLVGDQDDSAAGSKGGDPGCRTQRHGGYAGDGNRLRTLRGGALDVQPQRGDRRVA